LLTASPGLRTVNFIHKSGCGPDVQTEKAVEAVKKFIARQLKT